MTTITTKEQVLDTKAKLEDLYAGYGWFKKIELDSDEGGWCLNLKVTSKKEAEACGVWLHQTFNHVKICVYIVGGVNLNKQ